MLLAVDIGNTNITLGVYNDDILLFTARLATETKRTSDQYAIDIKDVIELHGGNVSDIEDCIIASVVPNVSTAVEKAVSTLFGIVPVILGPGVRSGLNIKIDNPAQLGADMVAAAVGALNEYTMPCIIVDMGTATTVSVLDENGSFLGCTISSGVRLTLKALTENTAQLPSIKIKAPENVIGKNTVDSIKSGLVMGSAAMIDGLIDRIEKEIGTSATIVATGGLSKEIISNCCRNIIYNPNLLLDGLRLIYEKNI